jgi:hypothetical protein
MTSIGQKEEQATGSVLTEDMIPVQNPELEFRRIPCCYLLVRRDDSGQALKLNESSIMIWGLCEEGRTIGDISRFLAEQFEHDYESMKQDVVRVIEDLFIEQAVVFDNLE